MNDNIIPYSSSDLDLSIPATISDSEFIAYMMFVVFCLLFLATAYGYVHDFIDRIKNERFSKRKR